MSDIEYMKIAIELAKKGAGYVNPNPIINANINMYINDHLKMYKVNV